MKSLHPQGACTTTQPWRMKWGEKLPKDKVRSHREHALENSSQIAKPRATREPNEGAFLIPEKKDLKSCPAEFDNWYG